MRRCRMQPHNALVNRFEAGGDGGRIARKSVIAAGFVGEQGIAVMGICLVQSGAERLEVAVQQIHIEVVIDGRISPIDVADTRRASGRLRQ